MLYRLKASFHAGSRAVLCAVLCAAHFTAAAPARAAEFPALPIETAEVRQVNSVPVLFLNGVATPPQVFFFNNEAASGVRLGYWDPQVRMSASAGVHIYSFVLRMPQIGTDQVATLEWLQEVFDPFIKADPKAVFIPRIYVGASAPWLAEHPDQQIVTADGTKGVEAIASDAWMEDTRKKLGDFLSYIEASEYGPRMIGYHLTGQTAGEWFPDIYREKGPDLSAANAAGFRAWLTEQYKTDAALQDAWSSPTATLAAVKIPVPAEGRFPIANVKEGIKFRAYYDLDTDFEWVDYSRYTSAITARRLLELCALIKEKTNRRKLTVLFYGYNMDLPASVNGHNEIVKLLESPDVDMLASPMSYQDRLLGASTGFMAAVDTIANNGKLWMIENDMRTHLWTKERQPPEIAENPSFLAELKFIDRPSELYETLGILKRDYAAMLVHRTGTWWMDLAAVGSFQDQAIWDLLKQYTPLFEAIYKDPQPYAPEVAMIIDEQSRNFEESTWDLGFQSLNNTRYQLGTTGATFGLYLLEDFEAGRMPKCKAYIFANSVALNAERVAKIRARLEEQGATAIWVYAPGWINGRKTNIEQMRSLTGMHLEQADGKLGSYSEAESGRQVWGVEKRDQPEAKTFDISPRFVVRDKKAEVLGRYLVDGEASTALKEQGGATHIYVGDINLTTEVLRDLLMRAGVHLWTAEPLAVHADERLLSVHVANSGVYEIIPPAGVSLKPQGEARILGEGPRGIFVAFDRAETIFFDLERGK